MANPRILKFRAWDVQAKSMIIDPVFHEFADINDQFGDDDFIFMQFTGLLDKEGKEIYEGDILSTDFAGNKIKGVMEYEITEAGAQWTKFLPLDRYEIIGNIYENPELLEGK